MTAIVDLLPDISVAVVFRNLDVATPFILDLETETYRSRVAAHITCLTDIVKPLQLFASFAQLGFGHSVIAPVLSALETCPGHTTDRAQGEREGNDAERGELHF